MAVVINVPAGWRINMFSVKATKQGPAKGRES
jgi:hypothetical protein